MPYNLQLLQNNQINEQGRFVAGSAQFRFSQCNSSYIYHFDVSPVSTCDSFSGTYLSSS